MWQIILIPSPPRQLNFLFSQICHAQLWMKIKHLLHEQSRLAAPILAQAIHDMMSYWQENARRCCGQWTDALKCWVEKRSRGTSSGLRLWILREYPQGRRWTCGETSEWHHAQILVHMPLPKPPSLPEKTSFLSFLLQDQINLPACVARWLRWSSLVHVPHSNVAFVEEYTAVHTSLKVARFRVASRASGGAVSACHPFASRCACNVSHILAKKSKTSLESCF